jgi:hypothetical protein
MHFIEGLTILRQVDASTRSRGTILCKPFCHSHAVGLVDAMDVIEVEITGVRKE